jgi:hypothetical protein
MKSTQLTVLYNSAFSSGAQARHEQYILSFRSGMQAHKDFVDGKVSRNAAFERNRNESSFVQESVFIEGFSFAEAVVAAEAEAWLQSRRAVHDANCPF